MFIILITTYSKNPNDETRPTIKQTTIHSTPHMNNVHNTDYTTYARNPNDETRPTIRQTTEKNKYQSNVHNNEHSTTVQMIKQSYNKTNYYTFNSTHEYKKCGKF